MQTGKPLSRRALLANAARLAGGALSAPLVAALTAGLTPAAAASVPGRLDKVTSQLLAAIAETIIPETDTPGAIEAGVPAFIEVMLFDWHDAETRQELLAGAQDIDKAAMKLAGKPFADLSTGEQLDVLQPFDAAAFGDGGRGHFFRTLKEIVTVGYYTSEAGATQELRYEPVPGPLQGCIPFEDVGRTWAL